jgi:competence protein ComEC
VSATVNRKTCNYAIAARAQILRSWAPFYADFLDFASATSFALTGAMPYLSLGFTTALVIGLACGALLDTAPTSWLSIALAAAWIAALVAFQRAWPRAQLLALAIAAVCAGWLLGSAAVDRALNPPLRVILEQRFGGFALSSSTDTRLAEPIVVEGRLRTDAFPSATGVVLRIDVERVWLGACPEAAQGGISVTVVGAWSGSELTRWTAGRTVRAPVLLRRPARYLDWGLGDQERAMARRGVSLVGTIKSAVLVEVIAPGRWWEEAAAAVRLATRSAMTAHVLPRSAPAAAIATALLIGDRAAIDEDTERRLQEAGTYHVIAISGGNIAILAGLCLTILGWLRARGRVAALVTIGVLGCYALIASGGASVARATLMAALYLAVRLIDQRTAAANAIALSGAALLLANPLTLFDVGFWLTFGATSAILAGASRVEMPRPRWRMVIVALLLSSVCAELAVAPVSASVFQRVTVAGLLLNFAAIPCMTVVQLAAMLLVSVHTVGAATLASWAGSAVVIGTRGLTDSTRLLDYTPWLTWRVPPPSLVVLATYYVALACWWSASQSTRSSHDRLSRASLAVAVLAFTWIVAAPAARVRALGDRRLHVAMVDVGQGDAILVTFPNGRTLLVDTGGVTVKGDFDIGERVIGPTLRAGQLVDLDYLAVTHGDPDHIGGAQAVVRAFQPRAVWWGVPVANHEPTERVRDEAARTRATWQTLQRGDRIEIGGVEVRVHHPPPPDWERQRVRNNDSLVLELRFGEVSLLLTGDIGKEVEQELLASLDLLPIVVLKVPHHGSGTSSAEEFVKTTHPAVALIGVGRANPYGHPVPLVLDRYRQVGTEIFRTDQDGEIELITDGEGIAVHTFTGRTWSMSKR